MRDAVYSGVESIRRSGPGVYPALNVLEDENHIYVTAELPGVDPADTDISVQGESLTIRGERKTPETEQEVNFHRREREFGVFRRVLNLPVKIDAEKVTAKSVDGVLKVILPKASEAKSHKIEIKPE
jgi:HSP20 family protein